jgi:transketolase
MKRSSNELEAICREIRQLIFKTAYRGNVGHLSPAFSIVEVLTVLYFAPFLRYDKDNPDWVKRDKLILSKGHASLALYAVLHKVGFLPKHELDGFCQPGFRLGNEPKLGEVKGVEATTGSLGHGLSFANGIALANKIDSLDSKTYVILGDGECQEGSVWEAAMSISHHKLSNVIAVVDRNQLQGMGLTKDIVEIEPIAEKWYSFGWKVYEMDGHDIESILRTFETVLSDKTDKPKLIISHTVKGKGISFMEGVPIWHYRMPNASELDVACTQLGLSMEDL